MNFNVTTSNNIIKDLSKQIAEQEEAFILEQLNELIKRDLIVIEKHAPIITQKRSLNTNSVELEVTSMIRLVPKEFEYIKKIEEENKVLKERLKNLKELFNETNN